MTDSNDDYIPLNQDKNIAIKKKKKQFRKMVLHDYSFKYNIYFFFSTT